MNKDEPSFQKDALVRRRLDTRHEDIMKEAAENKLLVAS